MRLTVCPHDELLHARRRRGLFALSPAAGVHKALAAVERTEDCSLPCYRHGGSDACVCEEDSPGTTAAPGGW